MELWHFEFLEGGPKRPKIGKNWQKLDLSILVFIYFLPQSPEGNPFKPSYPRTTEASALGYEGPVQNRPRERGEKIAKLGTGHFPIQIHFSALWVKGLTSFCLRRTAEYRLSYRKVISMTLTTF